MEQQIMYQDIIRKKETLKNITIELKEYFIGLDDSIDEVINMVNAWYLFPATQLRPTVVNLWGMTGSGKTALIQKLVELLDHKKFYAQMDMGEFESDSASWIKSTFTEELEFFHQQSCILCLDEFQFARTLDRDGKELGKDKLRVIWDLLDSGKISYIPGGNSFQMRRAETCLLNLSKSISQGVRIEKGIVVEGVDVFLDTFKGFYFNEEGRGGVPLEATYFLSDDFIKGIYYLYDDDAMSREVVGNNIKQCDEKGILALLMEAVKTRIAVKELDLSKSIIFVLGNLDEAYRMSHNTNPDMSADDLHEATSKINIATIKGALKKRFRNEQVARLGNNHIIYKSFTNAHFEELIRRELQRVNRYVKKEFGYDLHYHPSLHAIIYQEGVFPAQGTRPVLTTIKNLVEAWIGKIIIECFEKKMAVSVIEWSYVEDRYVFVFKDQDNTVLNIYEEKVNLRTDALRKTTNAEIQAHTAVHESGHAILAALTLRILPSVVISKTAADDCEGFCLINYPDGVLTRDVLKKDIIICLGGFVAEKMIFGEEHTSSGVYSDIENATELANKAIRFYAMGSDPIHLSATASSNNLYFFNKDKHTEEAMKLIDDCEKEAEAILFKNKLVLLKMAEYLTDYYKMEEADIQSFLKRYSAEEWVRTEGFVKKENYFSFKACIRQQLNEIDVCVNHL